MFLFQPELDDHGITPPPKFDNFSKNFTEIVLCLAIGGLVLNFQIVYAALGTLYLMYVVQRFVLDRDFEFLKTTGYFLFFAFLALFYYYYHHENANEAGDFPRTLELIWTFCLLFAVVESASYQIERNRPSLVRIASFVVLLNAAFLVAKIVYQMFFGNLIFPNQIFNKIGEINHVINVNANHVDGVVLVLVISLIWSIVVLWRERRVNFLTLCLAPALCCMYAYYFAATYSIAAYLALGMSILIVVSVWTITQKSNEYLVVFLAVMAVSVTAILYSRLDYMDNPKILKNAVSYLRQEERDRFFEHACLELDGHKRPHLTEDFNYSASIFYRVGLYSYGLDIWNQKPFLGHGIYDPAKFAEKYTSSADCFPIAFAHVHSLFIDILIRGGLLLLGVIAFTWFWIVRHMIGVYRSTDHQNRFVLLLTMVLPFYLAIENLFDLSFVNSNLLVVSFLAGAVVWCLSVHWMKYAPREQIAH